MSIVFDIFLSAFDNAKNWIARKLFWGRGSFISFGFKILSVTFAFILIISYLYRKPVVTSVGQEVASDSFYNQNYKIDTDNIKTDLVVMNSTITTSVPDDRGRLYSEEYIVKRGDTVDGIAAAYGLSVNSVLWANDLDEDDYINPGDTLVIPPSDGVIVTVEDGDTVYTLAETYEANSQNIVDFNMLDYPFTLTVGEKIFIPNGVEPAPVVVEEPVVVVASRSAVSNQYVAPQATSTPVNADGFSLIWPAGQPSFISQYMSSYHHGIDIASSTLPDIYAAASGTVIFAGCYGTCPALGSVYGGTNYAWSIQIDHGNGFTTWYAHLSNIYVSSGQYVSQGQVIGKMGSTGMSTGPHLHFELRYGSGWGSFANPLSYM